METIKLADTGLEVSAIGYGSMGTAIGYGPSDDAQSVEAIHRAYDLGVTMFDTARMYGWGSGERLLGKAVKPYRHNVVVATKFGLKQDLSPATDLERLEADVDESLANLGMDYVDILYQHRVDPQVPIEDVVGAMSGLVGKGKVRYLGLCEVGPEHLDTAQAVHPISVLQTEYSLFARDAEALFPYLRQHGIGFVAYSPLARGFLTGTARKASDYPPGDFRGYMPWWQDAHFEANMAVVDQIRAIATECDCSLAQLALAWILAKDDVIVPIPGSRNADRVKQNCHAVDVTLTPAQVKALDALSAHVTGDRGTPSPWLS